MEYGISFIEPAGLRIDEVGNGPSGKRRGAIGYRFGVEVIDRSGSSSVVSAVTLTAVLRAAMLSLTTYSMGRAEWISMRPSNAEKDSRWTRKR